MTRARELRMLDEEQLEDKLKELKETLFNLRFQHATGQLDNPMKIKEVRHDIARVCTVMTERRYDIHPEAFEEAVSGPVYREPAEEPEEIPEMETAEGPGPEEETIELEVTPESEELLAEEVDELEDL